MNTDTNKFENSIDTSECLPQDKIDSMIKFGENKIKQIHRRISENEVKLESMESHSDYEYKDLLKEFNEAEKDHKKDLNLFVDLLCKCKITVL
jgi:predicted  nucleic acid-binding Zn-ribbon protein